MGLDVLGAASQQVVGRLAMGIILFPPFCVTRGGLSNRPVVAWDRGERTDSELQATQEKAVGHFVQVVFAGLGKAQKAALQAGLYRLSQSRMPHFLEVRAPIVVQGKGDKMTEATKRRRGRPPKFGTAMVRIHALVPPTKRTRIIHSIGGGSQSVGLRRAIDFALYAYDKPELRAILMGENGNGETDDGPDATGQYGNTCPHG